METVFTIGLAGLGIAAALTLVRLVRPSGSLADRIVALFANTNVFGLRYIALSRLSGDHQAAREEPDEEEPLVSGEAPVREKPYAAPPPPPPKPAPPPSETVSGITIGSRIAMVAHDVPVANAMAAAVIVEHQPEAAPGQLVQRVVDRVEDLRVRLVATEPQRQLGDRRRTGEAGNHIAYGSRG